jgi:hypothetical protein
MDQFEALVGISQLGVALSGFAGVVFALSGHNAIELPENRNRLRVLLQNGLAACFLSLIPQFLWGLVSTEMVWALSSAAFVLYASMSTVRSWRIALQDRAADPTLPERVRGSYGIALSIGAASVVILQIGNVAVWQNFNVFFLGVSFVLLVAALMFIQLLASRLAA